MVLETVATLTGNAAGVDIVWSAWRHAAAPNVGYGAGRVLRPLLNVTNGYTQQRRPDHTLEAAA